MFISNLLNFDIEVLLGVTELKTGIVSGYKFAAFFWPKKKDG